MSTDQAGPVLYSGDKAEYVRNMFAGIADRYDLLNGILSFARHKAWRRRAVKLAAVPTGATVLDICTGTADFALDLARAVGPTGRVIASDFCEPMVRLGQKKTRDVRGGPICMMLADALHLPYASESFECATVGFGIRNVADTSLAFTEMARVLKPHGRAVCLEFNRPDNPIQRAMVHFFEMRVLPFIGGLLSRREAYTYLPQSIQQFHSRSELAEVMRQAGLTNVTVTDLNFGSVCIHIGEKP